MHTVQVQVLGL